MGEHLIQFEVSSNNNDYLDLRPVTLKLGMNITKTNDDVSPIKNTTKNPISSLYHQIQCYNTPQLINTPTTNYDKIADIVRSFDI